MPEAVADCFETAHTAEFNQVQDDYGEEKGFLHLTLMKPAASPREMKDMELSAVYRCVAALDVHQAKLTVCVLLENDGGEVVTQVREFGGFKRDRRERSTWVASFEPELIAMESTGIYRKSPCAVLGRGTA